MVRLSPVSSLRTMTVAPEIGLPLWPLMMPRTADVVSWAVMELLKTATNAAAVQVLRMDFIDTIFS